MRWDSTASLCNTVSYSLYMGDLDALRAGLYSHNESLSCDTLGHEYQVALNEPYIAGSHYFIVVPYNRVAEGSYGRGSIAERPVSGAPCTLLHNPNPCR